LSATSVRGQMSKKRWSVAFSFINCHALIAVIDSSKYAVVQPFQPNISWISCRGKKIQREQKQGEVLENRRM